RLALTLVEGWVLFLEKEEIFMNNKNSKPSVLAKGIRLLMLIALVAVMTAISGRAWAIVLYDVDFGTPPNTVGSPPVTGGGPAPRHTVSAVWITGNANDVFVSDAFGPLTDQPLVLNDPPVIPSCIESQCICGPWYPQCIWVEDGVSFFFKVNHTFNLPLQSDQLTILADLVVDKVQKFGLPFTISFLPYGGGIHKHCLSIRRTHLQPGWE